MEVKKIWLKDKESTIIAPFTIMDAIQDNDGKSLKEYIETHGGSGGGSGPTELPIATNETLGGVIVGDGLSIDETGVLSALGGGGGSTITVDSELSLDSTNPVQNKVITEKLNEVFQSVSDGKSKVAAAITDKGVNTAADDTFDIMAENIKKIDGGTIPQDMNSAFLIDVSETIYGFTDYSIEKFGIDAEESIYGLTDYSKEMLCIDAEESIYGFATYL